MIFKSPGGEYSLGKQRRTEVGGSDPHNPILGELPSGMPLHAVIDWDWTQSNWVITRQPSSDWSIFMGGGELSESVGVPLIHLGMVTIGEREMRFERLLASPEIDGEPVDEIEVGGFKALVFGRGEVKGDPEPGVKRVCLDPEDLGISSRHAVIEMGEDGFAIRDESKFGTFLNGRPFSRENLVYGDRFRIDDYVFEFLVTKIRRVDHDLGGRIQARELRKLVPNRKKDAARGETLAILDRVNLDIKPGEFVGILGGSGQGKSTLMNALCGINPATHGKVWINGVEISNRTAMIAAGIGYVPQDDIVHRELTVDEAVKRSAMLRLNLPSESIDSLIGRVLENLSLTEHRDKRVSNLSGGQRKRVSIATELLSRPSVLFLDEPTSGLDPAMESELMGWLQNLSDTGTTVVCTTHVLENAHLFDRLLVVQGGRVVFAGDHMEMRQFFLSHGRTGMGTSADGSMMSQSMGRKKLASLVKVYETLARSERSAEEWEERFLNSPIADPVEPEIQEKPPEKRRDRSRKVGPVATLWHLIVRQWLVLKADPLNVLFLMAQAVLIGLMIGWVAESVVMKGFLAVVATLWFGCSNGAQQIVGELPIFRRERVCGQGLNAYVLSKFLFLTTLTALQAVVLLIVIQGTAHLVYDHSLDEGMDVRLEEELVRRLFPVPGNPTASIEPVLLDAASGTVPTVTLVDGQPGLFEVPGQEEWLYTVLNPETDWKPGATVYLPTGQEVRLPAGSLPPYPSDGFEAVDVKPGMAESPFAPGVWATLGRQSKDRWEPGQGLTCPSTDQVFRLPDGLPSWPTESLRYRVMFSFLRFFLLEDAFLDAGKSADRPDVTDMELKWLFAFTIGLRLATLLLTACVGVAIGLMISSLVQNGTQAVMWVPLVLIPQILFGGFVVTVPEMTESVRTVSRIIPSYAAQRAMDVSHIFSRIVPKVTNETKMPVFSEGIQEEITWVEGDNEIIERYDQEVEENVSWQNLLVLPDEVGRRRIEERKYFLGVTRDGYLEELNVNSGVDSSTYRDLKPMTDRESTVDERSDVRPGYVHQSRFEYYGEAQIAFATLGLWLLGCYGVILGGLLSKQTGK